MQSLAAASQLASTLTLPDIPQQLLDGISLPASITNKIDPFLPASAKPTPSTTTNGITLTVNATVVGVPCARL